MVDGVFKFLMTPHGWPIILLVHVVAFNSFQGYIVSVFRFLGGHGEQLTLDFGCTILVSQLFS
jgi:hypothetical protein